MLLITIKEMSLEEQIQKSAEIYTRYNSRANNTAYYAYIEGAQSMLPKIEELEKHIEALKITLQEEQEQSLEHILELEKRIKELEKGK